MADRLTWKDGWRGRLELAVQALGFKSVAEYAAAAPAKTYDELVDALRVDAAPVQLIQLEKEHAISTGTYALFARRCLVRTLREVLPNGWLDGPESDFNNGMAWNLWVTRIGADDEDSAFDVWTQLKEGAPAGWLPVDAEDDLIVALPIEMVRPPKV